MELIAKLNIIGMDGWTRVNLYTQSTFVAGVKKW